MVGSVTAKRKYTEEEVSYLEERAALREHLGGQTRKQAEAGALEDLARWRERRASGGRA